MGILPFSLFCAHFFRVTGYFWSYIWPPYSQVICQGPKPIMTTTAYLFLPMNCEMRGIWFLPYCNNPPPLPTHSPLFWRVPRHSKATGLTCEALMGCGNHGNCHLHRPGKVIMSHSYVQIRKTTFIVTLNGKV